jgi:2-desacetyl-2-hydroxyethyl bacteriochlorophyllide A dehydrogenase
MDLDLKKVLLTRLIGRFYHNIYFSSYSPLQVQNLPRQSLPESSWVRVRNRLAGICGSDLHLLYGDGDVRIAPLAAPSQKHFYPGHEVMGDVIEIGNDVQHLNVGDRVVLQYGPNCLTAGLEPLCHACANGSYNLCEQGVLLAEQPLGGGWSEEMLLHEQQLFRVPDTLTDEQAVMLEPAAVALHAVLRHLPRPGDRALIIGAGTVGLLTQQIVHALAPDVEVSVMARYPFQIEQATRQGAANIIYPHDTYVGVQRATQARLYHGFLGNKTLVGGYDVIYDTIGQRQTLHHALRWTRAQGAVILVGINLRPMNIDLTPLWHQEISLLGSTSHGFENWPLHSSQQSSTFSAVADLIEQGYIMPENLITHHFALNNYKHALQTATKKAESRAIKVVFDYSLLPASVVPNVRASASTSKVKARRPTTIDFRSHDSTSGQRSTGQSQRISSRPLQPIQNTPPLRPLTRNSTYNINSRYSDEDYEDSEDTATALPVVGTREFRQYVPQTQNQNISIPRPPEYTRETLPVPPDRIERESDEHEEEEEGEQQTMLISKEQVKQQIPQTETNLSTSPELSDIQMNSIPDPDASVQPNYTGQPDEIIIADSETNSASSETPETSHEVNIEETSNEDEQEDTSEELSTKRVPHVQAHNHNRKRRSGGR